MNTAPSRTASRRGLLTAGLGLVAAALLPTHRTMATEAPGLAPRRELVPSLPVMGLADTPVAPKDLPEKAAALYARYQAFYVEMADALAACKRGEPCPAGLDSYRTVIGAAKQTRNLGAAATLIGTWSNMRLRKADPGRASIHDAVVTGFADPVLQAMVNMFALEQAGFSTDEARIVVFETYEQGQRTGAYHAAVLATVATNIGAELMFLDRRGMPNDKPRTISGDDLIQWTAAASLLTNDVIATNLTGKGFYDDGKSYVPVFSFASDAVMLFKDTDVADIADLTLTQEAREADRLSLQILPSFQDDFSRDVRAMALQALALNEVTLAAPREPGKVVLKDTSLRGEIVPTPR